MDIEIIVNSITNNFKDSFYTHTEDGDFFFCYGADNKFPFATIVTHDDDYDHVSNLDRDGFYRLNIGIDKEEFKDLFGDLKSKPGIGGFLESGIDFTKEDTIMPHPIYGNMYWICIVNPAEPTFKSVEPYLQWGYEKAVAREKKKKI